MAPGTYNAPVSGIPFFSPRHVVSPGTALGNNAHLPTLFRPLTIRGVTLRNRILVAPMCQYSTAEAGPQIGALTPYHVATLGHYALKGSSLVFIEATGVQFNGRISPNCPGIWSDSQIDGVKAVADMVHSQGALCGLQLAHAGRKASTIAPYLALKRRMYSVRAGKEDGGWPDDVVGPSGGEDFVWDGKRSDDPDGGYYAPREMTVQDIKQLVEDYAKAAVRGIRAGVDVLEIHAAHGYLLCEFLSPITNRRTDAYGGSFENRIRILVEVIEAIRKVIPSTMPLFLRISTTEWMDETEIGKTLGSWDVESSIKLAKVVSGLGIDLLDCSSGGNHPQQRISMFNTKDYQTKIAARIRKEVKAEGKNLLIGAVGLITDPEQARDIVEHAEDSTDEEAETAKSMVQTGDDHEAMADVILVGRQFLREPEWVLKVAWKLGIEIAWPPQVLKTRFPKL